MRQTALIYLHVTARLQLINIFKRGTSNEINFNTRLQLPSSFQRDSMFARETSKTKTALISAQSSLVSEPAILMP